MKRLLKNAALVLSLLVSGLLTQRAAAQVNVDVDISYQNFYDELSPYGEWVDYPDYGYVWVPDEPAGFMPYQTNGHWVWTDDYGWMWASDYSWGWAPFHYGRWFFDSYYGWMWLPGYEWSPAWVCWRDGGDYYGWAPLRPGFNISIGFSSYDPPVNYWCFAPRQYISSSRIYDYCLDRGRNFSILHSTTIINQYYGHGNRYFNGPRREDAERFAGRIDSYRFRDSRKPGRTEFGRNEVSLYRPRVTRDNDRQHSPARFGRYQSGDSRENSGNRGQRREMNDNNSRGNFPGNRSSVYNRRTEDNGRFDNPRTNQRPSVFGRNNQPADNNGGDRRGGFGQGNDRTNQPGYGDRNNGADNGQRGGGNSYDGNRRGDFGQGSDPTNQPGSRDRNNGERGRGNSNRGDRIPNMSDGNGNGNNSRPGFNRRDQSTSGGASPRRFDRAYSAPQPQQPSSGDQRSNAGGRNNNGGWGNRNQSTGNSGGDNGSRRSDNAGRTERSGQQSGGGRGGWRRG